MLAVEFLGEASCITRSAADQHAAVLQPSSDHALAITETNDQPNREKLIRRRWLETGIKMWNPDHHGAGHAALNIQGQAELLPPKPGETLPGYDTLEFKIVRSYVNGEAVNQIVAKALLSIRQSVEPSVQQQVQLWRSGNRGLLSHLRERGRAQI